MGGKAVVVGSAESITVDKLALNNIPGVNKIGNQDTTGNAATVTVKNQTTVGNRHFLTMVKNSVGSLDLHTHPGLYYTPGHKGAGLGDLLGAGPVTELNGVVVAVGQPQLDILAKDISATNIHAIEGGEISATNARITNLKTVSKILSTDNSKSARIELNNSTDYIKFYQKQDDTEIISIDSGNLTLVGNGAIKSNIINPTTGSTINIGGESNYVEIKDADISANEVNVNGPLMTYSGITLAPNNNITMNTGTGYIRTGTEGIYTNKIRSAVGGDSAAINIGTGVKVEGDKLTATEIAGTITTAAQPNITSVGPLISFNVNGAEVVGNKSLLETDANANLKLYTNNADFVFSNTEGGAVSNRGGGIYGFEKKNHGRPTYSLDMGGHCYGVLKLYDSHPEGVLVHTPKVLITGDADSEDKDAVSYFNSGNVAIGQTTASEKLEVNGNVKATKFKGPLEGIVGGTTPAAVTGTTITANTGFVGNVTGNVDGIVGGTTPAAVTGTTITANTGFVGNVTGNVDGIVGGTTPAAVTGTTITANTGFVGNVTGNVDGIVGGTTPAAVTGTTITANTGFVGNVTGQVNDISNHDTDDLKQGTNNKYYSDSLARKAISVNAIPNLVGLGELTYNNDTGVFAYVGPSQFEIRDLFEGGTGVTMNGGAFSIGQDVATTSNVTFNTVNANVIGNVDGVVGGNTPAAVTGTTITANTGFVGNVNGTVSSISNHDTDDLKQGTNNKYYSDSLARNAISVTDSGGDGSLAYDSATGVITYTGPTATETQKHFSGGTGVTLTGGEFSIGQDVGQDKDVTFNTVTVDGAGGNVATKTYVNSVATGLEVKEAVRLATTQNYNKSLLNGIETIDGVKTSDGDRILLKNQTNSFENGIYIARNGFWQRAADMNESSEISNGVFVFVSEGTANANTGWVVTTKDPIKITDVGPDGEQVWSQFSSAGYITAGTGLSKDGNTITVNRDLKALNRISVASLNVGAVRASPTEAIEVAGAIVLAASKEEPVGTIQYSNNDFIGVISDGNGGTKRLSLTQITSDTTVTISPTQLAAFGAVIISGAQNIGGNKTFTGATTFTGNTAFSSTASFDEDVVFTDFVNMNKKLTVGTGLDVNTGNILAVNGNITATVGDVEGRYLYARGAQSNSTITIGSTDANGNHISSTLAKPFVFNRDIKLGETENKKIFCSSISCNAGSSIFTGSVSMTNDLRLKGKLKNTYSSASSPNYGYLTLEALDNGSIGIGDGAIPLDDYRFIDISSQYIRFNDRVGFSNKSFSSFLNDIFTRITSDSSEGNALMSFLDSINLDQSEVNNLYPNFFVDGASMFNSNMYINASQRLTGAPDDVPLLLVDGKIRANGDIVANGQFIGNLEGTTLKANTITEKTTNSGVTIESVLLKDNVVTATTFKGALTGKALEAGIADRADTLAITDNDLLSDVNSSHYILFSNGKGEDTGRLVLGETALTYNPSTKAVTVTGGKFSGNLEGKVTTAAQPNITSVGTLTGLTINGDIRQTGNGYSIIASTMGVKTNVISGTFTGAVIEIGTTSQKVAIGQSSASEKLEVNGNVKATKFIGALEGNADTATKADRIKIREHAGWSGTGPTNFKVPFQMHSDADGYSTLFTESLIYNDEYEQLEASRFKANRFIGDLTAGTVDIGEATIDNIIIPSNSSGGLRIDGGGSVQVLGAGGIAVNSGNIIAAQGNIGIGSGYLDVGGPLPEADIQPGAVNADQIVTTKIHSDALDTSSTLDVENFIHFHSVSGRASGGGSGALIQPLAGGSGLIGGGGATVITPGAGTASLMVSTNNFTIGDISNANLETPFNGAFYPVKKINVVDISCQGLLSVKGTGGLSDLKIGSTNSGFYHFLTGTDKPFYFQRKITIGQNRLSSYQTNTLILSTNNHQNDVVFITNSKQVGIDKTPTSDFKLDVNGRIKCTSLQGGDLIQCHQINPSVVSCDLWEGSSSQTLEFAGSGNDMHLHTTGGMKIDGSVGIGKAVSSSYKLDVNGKINCEELYVDGNPFVGGGSQWTGTTEVTTSANLVKIPNSLQVLRGITFRDATNDNYYDDGRNANCSIHPAPLDELQYNAFDGHHFYTNGASGGTGNTERLTILGSGASTRAGFVGIGTTSPLCKLNIANVLTSSDNTIPDDGDALNNTTSLFLGKGTSSSENYWGLIMGSTWTSGKGYIQTYHKNTASSYPLLLQPTNGGNVGIGTTSPAKKLHVRISDTGYSANANAIMVLERNDNSNWLQFLTKDGSEGGLLFGASNNSAHGCVTYRTTTGMTFRTGGNNVRMTITSSGDVGIGKSPDSGFKLDVNGKIKSNGSEPAWLSTRTWYDPDGRAANSGGLTWGNPDSMGTPSTGLSTSATITASKFIGALDYSNLVGAPAAITNNNQLTNGAGYIVASSLNSLAPKASPVFSGNITGSANILLPASSKIHIGGNNTNTPSSSNEAMLRLGGLHNQSYVRNPMFVIDDYDNDWSESNSPIIVKYVSENGNVDYYFKPLTNGGINYWRGEIRSGSNITAYYSDERLKDFKGKITNPIEKIKQLNGYYFVENELAKSLGYDNDKLQVGVSAQEVEKVLPEIVTKAPIDDKYKTIWYEKLTPLLIEGIKSQQQQIESQQQQINELKEMMKALLAKK